MDKPKQSCRACKWYAVEARARGERITKHRVFPCTWPMPEIAWPASIARGEIVRLGRLAWMEPDSGADCLAWEKRQP